ncbi:universal stress protein [Thiobaca trueperi]|uniref:Nucleotide-binding universal stress UspA family protein n=1 Tax=Thiobaca trueperi TaxID=127458 RepID=A0A4R3N081_9GAMM|nr:universal stress protein [Thiobaca trueperi]TCT21286.1 nucleotide-binding universal stress UspA family protein [Thiobaca trueperi]
MMTFLVPTDGSEYAERAVRYLIKLAGSQTPGTIHLVNVRRPIDAWEVRRFLTDEEIQATQHREGEQDMASACALLDEAGITYSKHVLIGPIAPSIARFAAEQGCDAIVMGSHGRGELGNLLLGSIATKVIHLTTIPVTLVR